MRSTCAEKQDEFPCLLLDSSRRIKVKIQVLNIQGFAFDLAGEDYKQPGRLPLPPE